jgi:hypothetical protein
LAAIQCESVAIHQIRCGAYTVGWSGEAAVGVVFSHEIVMQMGKGVPIVLNLAKEGMDWEIDGMAIVKGAKQPELPRRGSIGHWSPRRRSLAPSTPHIKRQPSPKPSTPPASTASPAAPAPARRWSRPARVAPRLRRSRTCELIGGEDLPMRGEVSLAHHGLFLGDELSDGACTHAVQRSG